MCRTGDSPGSGMGTCASDKSFQGYILDENLLEPFMTHPNDSLNLVLDLELYSDSG